MEGDNIFRYRNMDIKLGGREMATVVYSNEEDDMCSLVIDGEEYVEDEERAIIPKAVLKQIRVEDIPDNFQIEICESKDSSVIMVSVPMTFIKVGKNEFQVIYDELITRKYWDGPVGLDVFKISWLPAECKNQWCMDQNNSQVNTDKSGIHWFGGAWESSN